MKIEQELKLDFKDVLIRPKRSTLSSRSDVDITRRFTFKHSRRVYQGIPIIAANMDHTGTFDMALALSKHGLMTALHKHYSVKKLREFVEKHVAMSENDIFYSMGVSDVDLEKVREFSNEYRSFLHFLCLDVANGYSEKFVDFVKEMRDKLPATTIMAGNVVTNEMTEELILAGADIVKVGIGPGSVCTTRIKTGVGYPQLSAVIECADAAHGLGGHICSDGGCNVPGDVAKAFGAGADFVMLGGMLSGHAECEGEIIYDTKYIDVVNEVIKTPISMKFYGMSSDTAMEKYSGGVAEYRASEGKTVEVPYRGPVENTVKEILGGLRSTLTYTGSRRLKELTKRTTFVRVTQQENTVFGKE